jgi:hypothetical protein
LINHHSESSNITIDEFEGEDRVNSCLDNQFTSFQVELEVRVESVPLLEIVGMAVKS